MHSWSRDEGGRGGRQTAERSWRVQEREVDACRPVQCQRLFPTGKHASYFIVTRIPVADSLGELQEQRQGTLADAITSAVFGDLAILEQSQGQSVRVVPKASAKEVSP